MVKFMMNYLAINMNKREKRFAIGLALLIIPLLITFPLALVIHKNSPDILYITLLILFITSFSGAITCGMNDNSSTLPPLIPIPKIYNKFELKYMNIAFKNRKRSIKK